MADDRRRRLEAIIEPSVRVLGYELLGIEYSMGPRRSLLRLYIDSEQGISLDDCERVSRQVSGVLDVEDPIAGGYTLEVSSPGLDRPLFAPSHFERFVGRRVRVRMRSPIAGRRKFSGTLKGFEDGKVLLEEDGTEHALPHDGVSSARLLPEL